MPDSNLESEALRKKIEYLERENQLLKELLQEAGIDYEKRLREFCGAQPEDYDPDQGARIKPLQITEDTANYFFRKFWGRKDVYELRYTNPKTVNTKPISR